MRLLAKIFFYVVLFGLFGWLLLSVCLGVFIGTAYLLSFWILNQFAGVAVMFVCFIYLGMGPPHIFVGEFCFWLDEKCPVIPRTLIFLILVVVLVTFNLWFLDWLFTEEVSGFLRRKIRHS